MLPSSDRPRIHNGVVYVHPWLAVGLIAEIDGLDMQYIELEKISDV